MRNSDLLTAPEAAELLGVTVGTLSVWRCTGRYSIPFVKIGRSVKYRRDAIERFIESRTCTHTGQVAAT